MPLDAGSIEPKTGNLPNVVGTTALSKAEIVECDAWDQERVFQPPAPRALANNDNRDFNNRDQKDRVDNNLNWVQSLKNHWKDPRHPKIEYVVGQNQDEPKDAITLYINQSWLVLPATERNLIKKINIFLSVVAPEYLLSWT